jgi:RNA polymerase sigma-70 factor (ECF subfamily)
MLPPSALIPEKITQTGGVVAHFQLLTTRLFAPMIPLTETATFLATCEAIDDPADHDLLLELRSGNESAAAQLYKRYVDRLRALADRSTGKDLSHRFDSEDVIQSVFRCFFERARNGLYDVPTGGDLWPLLLVIALQKVRAYGSHHRAGCRDVRRESGSVDRDTVRLASQRMKSEEPQSLLKLIAEETLEQLPELHRQVARWRLEGYDHQEIAIKTGRSKRTIERLFQECREILQQLLTG